VSVLATLAIGSTLEAIARLMGSEGIQMAAGYAFIISSVIEWWVASAMMFEETFGRTIISVGKKQLRQNTVAVGIGEPGVNRGQ